MVQRERKEVTDEEILEGPLKGVGTKEEKEVYDYAPPSAHRLLFKRRVFEIEGWCRKQGVIERGEVLAYIQARWDLNAKQAGEYLAEVVKDFERIGKVYGRNKTEKIYER